MFVYVTVRVCVDHGCHSENLPLANDDGRYINVVDASHLESREAFVQKASI